MKGKQNNQVHFETTEEIINASQDYLKPLIGRLLTDGEKELVKQFFFHYLEIKEIEEPIIISNRSWIIYSNKLTIMFENQIREFDNLLDQISIFRKANPDIISVLSENI